MEYRNKESPQQKIFKTKASAGKDMLIVFWNSKRGVLQTYFKKNQQ